MCNSAFLLTNPVVQSAITQGTNWRCYCNAEAADEKDSSSFEVFDHLGHVLRAKLSQHVSTLANNLPARMEKECYSARFYRTIRDNISRYLQNVEPELDSAQNDLLARLHGWTCERSGSVFCFKSSDTAQEVTVYAEDYKAVLGALFLRSWEHNTDELQNLISQIKSVHL